MKRNVLRAFLVMLVTMVFFAACASAPIRESHRLFMEETGLSLVIPMRFYTWVNVDNANRVQRDIVREYLDFVYDESGDYLLRIEHLDNMIQSNWGNQLFLQEGLNRDILFSAFIIAIYALENGQDPLDKIFEVLNIIYADGSYREREMFLIPVFRNGLFTFRKDQSVWEEYKAENFIVEENTIRIRYNHNFDE